MSELLTTRFLRLLLPAILMIVLWGAAFVFVVRVRTGCGKIKALITLAVSIAAHLYVEAFMRLNGSGLELKVPITELMKKMTPLEGFLAAFVLLALFIWSAVDLLIWNRDHITNISVKKSLDTLPAGVLVYTGAGLTLTVNPVMEMIAEKAFGLQRINGPVFEEKLNELGSDVISTGDGKYYSHRKHQMIIDGMSCYEIICDDVTEEYGMKLQLEKENERLRKMNDRLKELNRTIDSMVIEDEILSAKVMVHDRLGQALLATRYYLDSKDKPEGKAAELLKMWKEEIRFFEEVPERHEDNEFSALKAAADDVGIRLICDGTELTGDPFAGKVSDEVKHIFITAIHECMTNTLRHAGGDELYIGCDCKDRCTLTITNNGRPPASAITEKGGLKSLRSMTEKAGGIMSITSDERFVLKIEI